MPGDPLGVLTFAESVTAELHAQRDSQGFEHLKRDALDGGKAGGKARLLAEETLGRPIVTDENFLPSFPSQRRIRKKKEQPKLLE